LHSVSKERQLQSVYYAKDSIIYRVFTIAVLGSRCTVLDKNNDSVLYNKEGYVVSRDLCAETGVKEKTCCNTICQTAVQSGNFPIFKSEILQLSLTSALEIFLINDYQMTF
jgi:hypothetical protein